MMRKLLTFIAVMLFAGSALAGEYFREINGVRLSVQEEGEGQAIIFIHGRGYAKEYMNSLFDYYKGKYHVFSYDTRGHGKSDKPEAFTLDDDADDLAAFIEAYGLKNPVVVGFSMGSYITLRAAEKYPGLISKIILIGTRGRGDRYADEDIASMTTNNAAILRALMGFDNMTDIKKVKIPALVITGENDKINPVSEGRKVAEALPNASFHVIPDAEHVAFMKPAGLEQVCRLIDSFIAQRELTYSDHEPLGNMRTRFLNDVFFPAIERESGGRIKIAPHWNGELSISYENLNTVKDGSLAQISVIVPEYSMKELPLHQLFKSFPVGPSGQEQVNFFRRVYDEIPALTHELDAQNIHPIIIATGYPAAFFSLKPLASLHDIKGQKWRSASFWHKDFLANAGATPVTIPWGQGVYDALNDGTLDGLIVNVDSGYDLKAHEAAPNILVSRKLWLGHEYIIAMNKDVWESLSDEDRKAIERAAESSYRVLGGIMDEAFDRQLEILRAEGANVRILTDDEAAFWEAATNYEAIQEKYISEHSGAGEVLEAIRKCMN